MIRAPMTATLTSRSMPTTLAVSARAALITIGVPATAAAATMKMLPTSSEPNTLAATNEATINNPEIIGIVHRPFPHLCSLPISLILPERSSTPLARYRYGRYEGRTIPTMTRVNQRHDSLKSLATTLPLTARRSSRRAGSCGWWWQWWCSWFLSLQVVYHPHGVAFTTLSRPRQGNHDLRQSTATQALARTRPAPPADRLSMTRRGLQLSISAVAARGSRSSTAVQRRPESMMPSLRSRLITRETDSSVEPTMPARSARDRGSWSRVPRLPERS